MLQKFIFQVKLHLCLRANLCCSSGPLENFLKDVTKIVFEALAGDCRQMSADLLKVAPADISMEVEHSGSGTQWKSGGIVVEFGPERRIVTKENLTFDNSRMPVEVVPSIVLLN